MIARIIARSSSAIWDGPSQMGLEDLSMFRSVFESKVLYPSDAVSAEKLVAEAAASSGVVYIRTTRPKTPVLYRNDENFAIGGSKVVRSAGKDVVTVVGAGVTLHEAIAAADLLAKEGVKVRVIDAYSIKPLDVETLSKAWKETRAIRSDREFMAEIRRGLRELKKRGRIYTLEELIPRD